MSKTQAENVSDDEFQDAISEMPNTKLQNAGNEKTTDEIVEDIIEQQMNLNLKDENCDDEFKDATSEKAINDINLETETENGKPEYIEEMITEDELKELEKSMTVEELQANREKAHQMKLEANELFKNDKNFEAIEIYTQALKLCPTLHPKERAILYGNRAAAKIKVDLKKSAVDDCTEAINLDKDYIRVLLRRAKLYEWEDKPDLALDDYNRVYELDKGQPEAREAVVRLTPIVKERNEKIKTECMDKLKELGNMVLKPFGLSTANFQMVQDPASGGYTINFDQNRKS